MSERLTKRLSILGIESRLDHRKPTSLSSYLLVLKDVHPSPNLSLLVQKMKAMKQPKRKLSETIEITLNVPNVCDHM